MWKAALSEMPKDEQEKYLDEILSEAYALVREAAKRVLGQRAFDVQVMAAVTLHQGKIAEQKTAINFLLVLAIPIKLTSKLFRRSVFCFLSLRSCLKNKKCHYFSETLHSASVAKASKLKILDFSDAFLTIL